MPPTCKFFKVFPKLNYYIYGSKKGVSTEINNCFYLFLFIYKLFPCVFYSQAYFVFLSKGSRA